MAWWGTVQCPVVPAEQEWIEKSADFLLTSFGADRLRAEVVLPTDDYFPGAYSGSRADVRAVFAKLCAHMGVDPSGVDLEHEEQDEDALRLRDLIPMTFRDQGAAGHYQVRDGRAVVTVQDKQAARPMELVATVAHELCHVRLLGEGRIPEDRKDGEPLTDLATVFFGLGIFSANSSFEHHRTEGYTTTSRLGYLTEPMWGYALAYYAWLRGEENPSWARHLDTNPRTYLKRGLRYLRSKPR